MARLGFHASHEQLAPSALLEAVRQAEEAGFTTAMCSDHFAPWSHAQGHSGYAWSWLGAALAGTGLPFGVVSAPGQRYHPAVAAQKAATLCEMFPGRFWMALGSGQALNEHITGDRWPAKPERKARLRECVDVMRALFAGECVSHRGLVTVDRAQLYTLPETPPPLIGAAVSAETARWAGSWADGLITVNQDVAQLRRVVEAFREGGGAGKPVYLQVHLSWAEDEQAALRIAHEQWRTGVLGGDVPWNLSTPEEYEQASATVRPDDVRRAVLVSADLERHAGWLAEYADLGFDTLFLHHVGQEQRGFIDAFGQKVLPQLREPA
ncbi:TIGR03885 family FMN-dependent LLM class oxidoreductase [Nonomuraea ferruginea]|uniref:TIGR03885 family FMN-dependent LLM class oxidoreductase n=1 Tax=Nonomuraea ferruginea TaxID=46174 RepID=A0ABT4SSP8_9ACTN|nr:TIGR03885 family FMN-dependent LLM class oxidoreductase [Nonomuraea ferruginea]MDA0640296.1 TIGR03885 family FMN-dependent LLM class oxidoreductase [Nonomuraea ferruginea]